MEQRHHQIEYLPLDSVVPYINNPRDNADAVDPVASSIAEFDFNSPIAVDAKHVIINGHTRYLAAKKLGLKEIPCIICDHLTEAQCKAYRLADNRVAEYSTWDADKLMAELDRLGELDYNDVPGFDSSFLDSLATGLTDMPDPTDPGTPTPREHQPKDEALNYTRKIDNYIYEPTQPEAPPLSDLTDLTTYQAKLQLIDKADVPEDIKQLARLAASRFITFDFGKVAEYYCHQPEQVQALFEQLALVIIDYNDAIAQGFVKLNSRLADIAYDTMDDGGSDDDG